MGQDMVYLWTVEKGETEGGRGRGLFLRMTRVAIGRDVGKEEGAARLSSIKLYTKTLVDPAGVETAAAVAVASSSSSSSSSTSKKRSSPTTSYTPPCSFLPLSVQTVGMQAQGLIVTAVEEVERKGSGEGGVRLQAWDAEHGVVVGEACPPSSSFSLPSTSSLFACGEGVIASGSPSTDKVAAWRVESREGGGEGTGLRRALGKLAVTTAAAAACATGTVAAPLVTMTFKSSEVGWVCQEREEDATGAAAGAAAAAAGGLTPDDAVDQLLQLLFAAEQEQQQQYQHQHQHQQNGKADTKKKEEEERNGSGKSCSSSKKRKRAKLTGAVLLARTPVATQTALYVASLCLAEEDEEGGEGILEGGRGKKARRRKSREGQGEGATEGRKQERQAGLWRLLQALIEAGKYPLREHPTLLLQLLQRGRKEVVAAALAGPGDLSEKSIVQSLRAVLRSPSSLPPSSISITSQEQQQQQQQQLNNGVYAREVFKLVGLAVCRPCCPVFLRAALSEGMDGPSAALLLVLLRSLLEKTIDGNAGGGGREEECILTWLEALLDAKFVSMVVQGSREGGQGGKERDVVRKVLMGVRECARRGAMACEALELVEGYFAQFKRAGQSFQAISDYSLESISI